MRLLRRDTPGKDRELQCWRIATFTTRRIGTLSARCLDCPVTRRAPYAQLTRRPRRDAPIARIQELTDPMAKRRWTPSGPAPPHPTPPLRWLVARTRPPPLES